MITESSFYVEIYPSYDCDDSTNPCYDDDVVPGQGIPTTEQPTTTEQITTTTEQPTTTAEQITAKQQKQQNQQNQQKQQKQKQVLRKYLKTILRMLTYDFRRRQS